MSSRCRRRLWPPPRNSPATEKTDTDDTQGEIVHEGATISGPRAESDTHYLIMGIDLDLDRAMRHATWEVVDFLVAEKGLTQAEALSLASIAVDFRVSEVVDLTQVVTRLIPKSIFLR